MPDSGEAKLCTGMGCLGVLEGLHGAPGPDTRTPFAPRAQLQAPLSFVTVLLCRDDLYLLILGMGGTI